MKKKNLKWNNNFGFGIILMLLTAVFSAESIAQTRFRRQTAYCEWNN